MKISKSKRQIRQELDNQVHEFLRRGGEVTEIPSGISGNVENQHLFRNAAHFSPRETRTPLHEVVKTLESRKRDQSRAQTDKKNEPEPKRKLIVDDFGDPVRWTWE